MSPIKLRLIVSNLVIQDTCIIANSVHAICPCSLFDHTFKGCLCTILMNFKILFIIGTFCPFYIWLLLLIPARTVISNKDDNIIP